MNLSEAAKTAAVDYNKISRAFRVIRSSAVVVSESAGQTKRIETADLANIDDDDVRYLNSVLLSLATSWDLRWSGFDVMENIVANRFNGKHLSRTGNVDSIFYDVYIPSNNEYVSVKTSKMKSSMGVLTKAPVKFVQLIKTPVHLVTGDSDIKSNLNSLARTLERISRSATRRRIFDVCKRYSDSGMDVGFMVDEDLNVSIASDDRFSLCTAFFNDFAGRKRFNIMKSRSVSAAALISSALRSLTRPDTRPSGADVEYTLTNFYVQTFGEGGSRQDKRRSAIESGSRLILDESKEGQ